MNTTALPYAFEADITASLLAFNLLPEFGIVANPNDPVSAIPLNAAKPALDDEEEEEDEEDDLDDDEDDDLEDDDDEVDEDDDEDDLEDDEDDEDEDEDDEELEDDDDPKPLKVKSRG